MKIKWYSPDSQNGKTKQHAFYEKVRQNSVGLDYLGNQSICSGNYIPVGTAMKKAVSRLFYRLVNSVYGEYSFTIMHWILIGCKHIDHNSSKEQSEVNNSINPIFVLAISVGYVNPNSPNHFRGLLIYLSALSIITALLLILSGISSRWQYWWRIIVGLALGWVGVHIFQGLRH